MTGGRCRRMEGRPRQECRHESISDLGRRCCIRRAGKRCVSGEGIQKRHGISGAATNEQHELEASGKTATERGAADGCAFSMARARPSSSRRRPRWRFLWLCTNRRLLTGTCADGTWIMDPCQASTSCGAAPVGKNAVVDWLWSGIGSKHPWPVWAMDARFCSCELSFWMPPGGRNTCTQVPIHLITSHLYMCRQYFHSNASAHIKLVSIYTDIVVGMYLCMYISTQSGRVRSTQPG